MLLILLVVVTLSVASIDLLIQLLIRGLGKARHLSLPLAMNLGLSPFLDFLSLTGKRLILFIQDNFVGKPRMLEMHLLLE